VIWKPSKSLQFRFLNIKIYLFGEISPVIKSLVSKHDCLIFKKWGKNPSPPPPPPKKAILKKALLV
jgi:hypothetical protein